MAFFGFFKKKKTEPEQIKPPVRVHFEYDAERQVLIRCSSDGLPQIIERSNLVWRNFGPQDEPYARAIFLGQGCWERLDSVKEEEAYRILERWGYSFESE